MGKDREEQGREEVFFFGKTGVVAGMAAGTIVTAMLIHLALPHTHILSPAYMDGILIGFESTPLAVRDAAVIGFGSLFTALAMGFAEDVFNPSKKKRRLESWPDEAVLEQKVMSFIAPIMAVLGATVCWFFVMGDASPLHLTFFGPFKGFASAAVASWSVWFISFLSSLITVILLAAPKTTVAGRQRPATQT